jgi:hypothetical protein
LINNDRCRFNYIRCIYNSKDRVFYMVMKVWGLGNFAEDIPLDATHWMPEPMILPLPPKS